ncbi:MAG: hypothetical protein ABI678_31490 [Kofleriaceae bacterium]
MTKLDDHVSALRDLGGELEDGAGTRLRVRRSLEQGHGMRRHAGLLVALMVLLVTSASWGFATGRIQKLFEHAPAKRVASVEPKPIVVEPEPAPAPVIAPAPTPVVIEPAPAPIAKPARARVAPVAPVEHAAAPAPISPLYAHAYELYFHGSDYAKALDALDDYLAKEPAGQFVVEAKYNRALCLIHLDRLSDAKLALLPFAAGEVAPAGYRQSEAKTLIEKIDRRTNSLNGTK